MEVNEGLLSCPQCLGPCLGSDRPRSSHRDSLQFTNDGFQNESDPSRGATRGWNNILPRRCPLPQPRSRILPLDRQRRHCSACGVYTNHTPKGSPSVRRGRGEENEYGMTSILAKRHRKEGQKTVWFKESEDSSDIEVEIIPDSVGRVEEETEEELEVEMEGVIRDPAAPLTELSSAQESWNNDLNQEQNPGERSSDRTSGESEPCRQQSCS